MTLSRVVLLDLPLMLSAALYLGMVSLERISRDLLVPQLQLQMFTPTEETTGLTYYHRLCDSSDASTATDPSDLMGVDVVDPKSDSAAAANQAVHIMLEHGVTVLPNLLSPETATALRDFILTENEVTSDLIHVIENQHRWSFPLKVDQHFSVRAALDEVLHQPVLVDLLVALAGPNPAVIEFTAITQAYGAQSQFWHQDVGNAAKHGRNFVPSYGLFIPLQNVTASMGATGICPGTHICADDDWNFCDDTGFQLSGRHNNWPLGTGALINQQTTHRGEAHVDPTGAHRVVFIITFAPRPQTRPNMVETRLLGLGGSYSLHWSHWGHTLADFQQPLVHMRQPWRTLRSLGLYKPRNSQWGWDYVTVLSGRIANGEMSSSPRAKDMTWLLPIRLQGSSKYWLAYLLQTVQKCRKMSAQIYLAFAVAYVAAFAVLDWKAQRRDDSPWSMRKVHIIFRVLYIHGALQLVSWWLIRHAMESPWGHKLATKRSFSLSPTLTLPLTTRPHTLPTKRDILVFEGMQSSYFDSYTQVLDVSHPGNKAWYRMVSSLAHGYDQWSQPVQRQVQHTLWYEISQREHRRILMQSSDFEWAVASPSVAFWWAHKCLFQMSNRHVHVAVETVDFLLSEVRFGYWRSTALQQRFISALLVDIRVQLLLDFRAESGEAGNVLESRVDHRPSSLSTAKFSQRPWTRSLQIPRTLRPTRASQSLQVKDVKPPVDVTGPSVGDVVDATVPGPDNDVWYRARVVAAHSKAMTWNVVYDDGEEGLGLCDTCVRLFAPYTVGETVEVLLSDDTTPISDYAVGTVQTVTSSTNSTLLDVHLTKTGQVIVRVSTRDIRRRR